MILEKLLGTLLATALAFLLAGAFFVVPHGFSGGWIFFALFAAVPAAILAPMPFGVRVMCIVLGLLGYAATFAMELGGADSPLKLLPWIAICFAAAAVVAELAVRIVQRLRAKPTPA